MSLMLIRGSLFAAVLALIAAAVAAETLPAADAVDTTGATGPLAVATFGGGCYWCTESDFDKVDGVVETTSGFMGGHTPNPTYEEVGTGLTGHVEVVQVKYDPNKVSYETLVDYYWHHVDILDGRGQFCDRGSSYRPVIFTHTPEQQRIASAAKTELDKSQRFKRPIAVAIEPASKFTPGPVSHQNYYMKNPLRYRFYRTGCGRDARLQKLWGNEATN